MRKLPPEEKKAMTIKALLAQSSTWMRGRGVTEDVFFSRWRERLVTLRSERRAFQDRCKNKNPDKWKAYHRKYEAARRNALPPDVLQDIRKRAYLAGREKNVLNARAKRAAMKTDLEKMAKYNEYRRQYITGRFSSDPLFKLKYQIRTRIGTALKRYGGKKTTGTTELIGCTVDEYRAHIESLWLPGMSWQNYGLKGWHIDHKKPCASFDFSNPEEIKKCFHFSNTQPLWHFDNLSKGDRMP
jgi:hypothetical protein